MWILIFLAAITATLFSIIFLGFRIGRFYIVKKLTKNKKLLSRLLGIGIMIVLMISLFSTINIWNMMISIIHLLVIWIICDLVTLIIRKYTKKTEPISKFYIPGICAIVLTIAYLGYGWYSAHNVVTTNLSIETEKPLIGDKFRIIGFTDSHVGTTFSGEEMEKYIERMNNEKADIAVIVGDFVDDETSKDDMEKACKQLGKLKTTYGVYYVFGNHDKGYYSDFIRGYGEKELVENLEKNNVTVLEDGVIDLNNNVTIIGRADKSSQSRMEMEEFSEYISKDKFSIVLDHQPNDYKNEENANVDLVLSGHTHGGQMIPFINLGKLTGLNDKIYGYEKRLNSNFFVSSGIADWAIKYKTGCISEYFVIDVNSKA